MKFFRALLLIALTLAGLSNLFAQIDRPEKKYADGCEFITSKLSSVINEFNEKGKTNNTITIIAGAAKGENPRHNERRLKDTVKGLNFYGRIKSEQVILGISRSADNFAFLKFYINGTFFIEINSRKNVRLCFSDGWTF
jgi:hypothetical protein